MSLKNIEINEKEGFVLFKLNPKMYPLEVIYSAAYVFLDKAYVLLDEDSDKNVLVELRRKQDCDLEQLGRKFGDELLNYAVYKTRAERSKDIRTAIVQRALLTNDFPPEPECADDPQGIAIPWEEKYGNRKKCK